MVELELYILNNTENGVNFPILFKNRKQLIFPCFRLYWSECSVPVWWKYYFILDIVAAVNQNGRSSDSGAGGISGVS